MIIWIVAAAAVAAVLAWPAAKVASPFPASKPAGPTYMEAIAAVQLVRTRLIKTDKLSDECQKSIDTLTLSLVSGSDK